MPYERLLSEGRIGRLTLRNRMITSPMARGMSNRDGTLTQTYVDYLAERARGGASLVFTEGAYVDVLGNTHLPAAGAHGDHVIPGLRRAADAVHAEGALFGVELFFGGRVGKASASQRQPLGPSDVPCVVHEPNSFPREMTQDDIDYVVERFADGARRSVEAGADIVHLHGGHGYLLAAFVSPFSNKRTDAYGGSAEGRARFSLEVVAAIRRVVGPDFPIGYRLNGEDYVEGGCTIEDSIEFAKLLVDAGVQLLDVSGGLYESKEMTMQGAGMPRGGFVENARRIKEAIGDAVPVSAVQRLNVPDFAENVLANGWLDFVTIGRGFHADPHFVRKLREDRAEDIVPCIACLRCLDLHGVPTHVRCAANPATGLERQRRRRPAAHARRVLVVGGGVAGMQAAVECGRQGHSVVLLERGEELGGQIRYAREVAPDFDDLVRHLATQLDKLGVDVRTGVTADLATVQDADADAVVVATGARGGMWELWPVVGAPTTFDLFSAFERDRAAWAGERVVLIGGDSQALALALHLASLGATIDVIEPRATVAWDGFPASRGMLMLKVERCDAIRLHTEATVEEVGEGYALTQQRGVAGRIDGVGSVVVGERIAENALYEQILEWNPDVEVYAIGDAVVPKEIYAATQGAAEAAETIRLRSLVPASSTWEPAVAKAAG